MQDARPEKLKQAMRDFIDGKITPQDLVRISDEVKREMSREAEHEYSEPF